MRTSIRRLLERTSLKVEDREAWDAVKERGHTDWILWKGLIGSSIPIALSVHGSLWIFFGGNAAWSRSFGVNVVLIFWWAVAGYVAADVTWHQMERRYASESGPERSNKR